MQCSPLPKHCAFLREASGQVDRAAVNRSAETTRGDWVRGPAVSLDLSCGVGECHTQRRSRVGEVAARAACGALAALYCELAFSWPGDTRGAGREVKGWALPRADRQV